jgi:hypothetical protein
MGLVTRTSGAVCLGAEVVVRVSAVGTLQLP